uniref:BED-type domain-containing protein n=1 Tax=Hordeum vulgare subsp. vulgare TaxID=112509 RepID=A0A8I6X211_HORVV
MDSQDNLQDNTNFTIADFGLDDFDITMPPPMQPPYTDYQVDGQGNSSSGTGSSTSMDVRRTRRRTSEVWEFFDEEISMVGGMRKVSARCKRCQKELTGDAKGGTRHLKRHLASHKKADASSASSSSLQTHLKYNTDGTVSNFVYDPQRAREGLCRFTASNDLPLGIGESDGFVEFIQSCHNPNYRPVSRQTTSRDLKKLYETGKDKIKEEFSTCTFSVSLTSDIWTGPAKQDYIIVVTHYVTEH